MVKDSIFEHPPAEENMSNLTCASGEASVDSSGIYPPQLIQKKKRNQPGHPDPDAEVISLSPRTLMATNRFVCEICNKGFQRDQNLQLHRRGHNLPWKLKQRTTKEVKKKVYVCPEMSCIHNDPTRALGDLTGIKKHFSRKHGEKKWKCDKCSKKYAVQSDWKAHNKTCGTREYRCDCGTLFTRRDSFITHRAFCDALVQENSRSIGIIQPQISDVNNNTNSSIIQSQFINVQIKKEQYPNYGEIPPWLSTPNFDFQQNQNNLSPNQNPNPNPNCTTLGGPTTLLPPYHPPPTSPHFSATALLQKVAQMGAKSSTQFGQKSTTDQFVSSLACYGNYKAAALKVTGGSGSTETGAPAGHTSKSHDPCLFSDMMMMNNNIPTSFSSRFEGSTFEDVITFDGILNQKSKNIGDYEDGMTTRDFLGLRPLSQSDMISINNCLNRNGNCNDQNQSQNSWEGN